MPRVLIRSDFHNIRFNCQRCGTCCHHKRPEEFGDLVAIERLKEFWEKSNLIYLTHQDIENISRTTGLNPKKFVDTLFAYDGKSVRIDDSGRRLILDFPVMKSNADTTCVFYNNGCTIYSIRPKGCRIFPFRVEEETTEEEDIILNIGCNTSCQGVGKGKIADKKSLEKLVADQFMERSESVAAEIQKLAEEGRISSDLKIYRSHPGHGHGASGQ